MPVICVEHGIVPPLSSTLETLQAYNGLDCTLTASLFDILNSKISGNETALEAATYKFEMSLLAPALAMTLRGFTFDPIACKAVDDALAAREKQLASLFREFSAAAMGEAPSGKGINPNSPKQKQLLFYDRMKLPTQTIFDRKTKTHKPSVNEDSLLKLATYLYAKPLVTLILALGDVRKQRQFLKKAKHGARVDGKARFGFKPTTETGRFASSDTALREGSGNAQNQPKHLRRIFCAREGKRLGEIDLTAAESFAVAYISGDVAYMQALRSGDVHTYVARLCWPHLAWTGDLRQDRAIADVAFFRGHTYRDLAKKIAHGGSYGGQAVTLARETHITVAMAEAALAAFFTAFPGIKPWHLRVVHELQTTGCLITPFGRKRTFLSRLTDDATTREAIAFGPQSFVADYLNTALLKLWHREAELDIALLAQIHDAILFEYSPHREAETLQAVRTEVSWNFNPSGKPSLIIPAEIKTGLNWAPQSPENPNGLQVVAAA